MVGCVLFNTATLTILLANFGPYGNFINGIEHEPREEFRDYAYLRICAKNFPWGDGKHCLLFNKKARWNSKVGDQEPTHGWKPIPGVDDHHH